MGKRDCGAVLTGPVARCTQSHVWVGEVARWTGARTSRVSGTGAYCWRVASQAVDISAGRAGGTDVITMYTGSRIVGEIVVIEALAGAGNFPIQLRIDETG